MADLRERIIIEAVDNTTKGMRAAQNKLNAFERTARRVQTTLMGFVGINIGFHLVQGLQQASDAAVEGEAKLKLFTKGIEDFNKANEGLTKISLETGSALDANITLFTRINKSIQRMGGSTEDTLQFTRALNDGLRISGATTQETASVIRQLSQAMSSGVLRGEEFNAIAENGGRVLHALADALGVTIGQLRTMAFDGQLTSETVFQALSDQALTLKEEAEALPITVGRALENINTGWVRFLQTQKESNSFVAESLNTIALNMEEVIQATASLIKIGAVLFAANKITNYNTKLKELAQQKIAMADADRKQAAVNRVNEQKRITAEQKNLALVEQNIAAKTKQYESDQVASQNAIRNATHEQTVLRNKLGINQQLNAQDIARIQSTERITAAHAKHAVAVQKSAIESQKASIQEIKNAKAVEVANVSANEKAVASLEKKIASTKKSSIHSQHLGALQAELAIEQEKLNLSREKSVAISNQLTAANTGLQASETKLAAAITAEQVALERSNAAKKLGVVNDNASKVAKFELAAATRGSTIANTAHTTSLNTGVSALQRFNLAVSTYTAELVRSNAITHSLIISTNALATSIGTKLTTAMKIAGTVSKGTMTAMGAGLVKLRGIAAGVGNALFGWVGIAAFVAYEIANYFGVDFLAVFKSIEFGFRRIGIKLKTMFSPELQKELLAELDKEWDEWTDKRIADINAQKNGFRDAEHEKQEVAKQSVQKIRELNEKEIEEFNKSVKEFTDANKGYLDDTLNDLRENTSERIKDMELELEFQKSSLKEKFDNEIDYNTNLLELNRTHTEEVERLKLQALDEEIRLINDHYEEVKFLNNVNNRELVEAEKTNKNEIIDFKNLTHEEIIQQVSEHHKKQVDQVRQHNLDLTIVDKESYQKRFQIANESFEDRVNLNKDQFDIIVEDKLKESAELVDIEKQKAEDALKVEKDKFQRLLDFNEEGNEKLRELSIEQKENLREIGEQKLEILRGQLKRMLKSYDQFISDSKNADKNYLDFERKILGDRRSEYQKQQDAVKNRNEIVKQLREADLLDQQGNHIAASDLRKEANKQLRDHIENEKARADEAEKGSRTQVNANAEVKRSLDILKDSHGKVADSSAKAAKQQMDNIKDTKAEYEALKKEIKELSDLIDRDRTFKLKADVKQALDALNNVKEKYDAIKDKTVTVTIVEKRVGGDDSGRSGLQDSKNPQKRNSGGFINRENKVPGNGNQDTVKALLTPGEFIIKKSSVEKYGSRFLHALNNGQLDGLPRFAEGGEVGGNKERFNQFYNQIKSQLESWKQSGEAYQDKKFILGDHRLQKAKWSGGVHEKVMSKLESLKDSGRFNIGDLTKFKKMVDEAYGFYTRDLPIYTGGTQSNKFNSSKLADSQKFHQKFLQDLAEFGVQKFKLGGLVSYGETNEGYRLKLKGGRKWFQDYESMGGDKAKGGTVTDSKGGYKFIFKDGTGYILTDRDINNDTSLMTKAQYDAFLEKNGGKLPRKTSKRLSKANIELYNSGGLIGAIQKFATGGLVSTKFAKEGKGWLDAYINKLNNLANSLVTDATGRGGVDLISKYMARQFAKVLSEKGGEIDAVAFNPIKRLMGSLLGYAQMPDKFRTHNDVQRARDETEQLNQLFGTSFKFFNGKTTRVGRKPIGYYRNPIGGEDALSLEDKPKSESKSKKRNNTRRKNKPSSKPQSSGSGKPSTSYDFYAPSKISGNNFNDQNYKPSKPKKFKTKVWYDEKFATGGSVPGTGIGDTVKALLTPGEFVIKKSIVNQLGKDFFESINNGIMPKRFANGGLVGASGGSSETINVNLSIGNSNATGTFEKNDQTMQMIDELKRFGAVA